MAEQHLKFAIFGNEYQAKKSASIETILSFLVKKGAEVYVENAYYDFLVRDLHLDMKLVAGVFEDYNFDVDYVISMGGDGTFLKAGWGRKAFLSSVSTWGVWAFLLMFCRVRWRLHWIVFMLVSAR